MAQAIVQTREEMRRRSIRVPFETTEDLLQVPGMTYAIYAPLRHFVVADSDGRPGVNLEASPLALSVMSSSPCLASWASRWSSMASPV